MKPNVVPKERVRIPSLFNRGDMISAVRQLIKKKRAKGYGNKTFNSKGKAAQDMSHKDISKPEARRVFDYLLERRVLDNRLIPRKQLQGILMDVFFMNDKARAKDFLKERLWVLMNERKVKDRAQFLENFRLILEKVNIRTEHIVGEVRSIDYIGAIPKNPVEKREKYLRENTKDHMNQRLNLYIHLIDATRIAEEVVAELKTEL